MAKPLNILIIWHMHQPSYSIADEMFLLPWTRLHAVKDYYGMAKAVEDVDGFKCTFNFTPVLWDQIEKYIHGGEDKELAVIRKNTADLNDDERRFLMKKLVTGNYPTMIKPYDRYDRLYQKIKSPNGDHPGILSEQDFRDLIAWRILTWIDPITRERDERFNSLFKKGKNYTEEEKNRLIDASLEIIREIPEIYRKLAEENRVEITTTPYYHPILPLLINSDSAREALPHLEMPFHFSFADDAERHILRAIKKHESIFNRTPDGFWPAEGSVSTAAAELFIKHSVKWIATDEDILAKSAGIDFMRDTTGQLNHPDLLYRPYTYENDHGTVRIFFRDHLLSDLLGFEYQSWDVQAAVDDFIKRLCLIHKRVKDKPFQSCVPIILDGENAWEYYREGGFNFLRKLYRALADREELNVTTPSEFLQSTKNQAVPLSRLTAGSWINGNFGIWIGHPEENEAWKFLKSTRDKLQQAADSIDEETLKKCRTFLMKAQASDWFWWYGDDHYSEEKQEFDQLFRSLLINIYRELGEEPPADLRKTLLFQKSRKFKLVHPKMLLSPKIDGRKGGYYDWFGAGNIKFRESYGAMHASGGKIFQSLKFGFDLQKFYLRLKFGEDFKKSIEEGLTIEVLIEEPKPGINFRLVFGQAEENGEIPIEVKLPESVPEGTIQAACMQVFEMAIPFKTFNARRNDHVDICLELYQGGRYAGRIPDLYGIEFNVPTEDYDNLMWEV